MNCNINSSVWINVEWRKKIFLRANYCYYFYYYVKGMQISSYTFFSFNFNLFIKYSSFCVVKIYIINNIPWQCLDINRWDFLYYFFYLFVFILFYFAVLLKLVCLFQNMLLLYTLLSCYIYVRYQLLLKWSHVTDCLDKSIPYRIVFLYNILLYMPYFFNQPKIHVMKYIHKKYQNHHRMDHQNKLSLKKKWKFISHFRK